MITQARLKELLSYDPETGEFTWRVHRNGHVRAGMVAGNIHYKYGYREIRIGDKLHKAHRLVWLYVHGEFPKDQIDHVNGDRADNRLANLREATNRQQQWNCSRRNVTGYKGVSINKKTGLYHAKIYVNGRNTSCGYHKTPEEAHAAYCAAARKHFGEFAKVS